MSSASQCDPNLADVNDLAPRRLRAAQVQTALRFTRKGGGDARNCHPGRSCSRGPRSSRRRSSRSSASPKQAASGRSADGTLPSDVHPESRSRLPAINRDDLDERGRKAYDEAVRGAGSSRGLEGAAAIRLHASGVNVRWASPVGRQLTELAILTTAREHDQPYEWSLHEMEAVAVGLNPSVINLVRHRNRIAGVAPKEAAIIQMGREIFGRHRLSLGHLRAQFEAFREARSGRSRRLDGQVLRDRRKIDRVQSAAAAGLETVPPAALYSFRRHSRGFQKPPSPDQEPGPAGRLESLQPPACARGHRARAHRPSRSRSAVAGSRAWDDE